MRPIRLGADSGARGRWTAQLLVACKAETVDRLARSRPGDGQDLRPPRAGEGRGLLQGVLRDYASPKRSRGRRGSAGRIARQGEDRCRGGREGAAARRRTPLLLILLALASRHGRTRSSSRAAARSKRTAGGSKEIRCTSSRPAVSSASRTTLVRVATEPAKPRLRRNLVRSSPEVQPLARTKARARGGSSAMRTPL